jgi:DNA recombination protein RmuC
VVDAKAPMDAYLQAMDATDDATREDSLKRHARHVRDHITALATRDYTAQFEHAPDLTVCFLPAEALFCAALEADHELMQFAMEKRVLLATPFTLFALLKAVAASWQQVRILKNAQEIADRSKVLFDRIKPFAAHMAKVGAGLRQATGAYNDAVGSWQSRVLPQERAVREMINLKEGLPELGEVGEDLSHLPPGEGRAEDQGEDEERVELEGGE